MKPSRAAPYGYDVITHTEVIPKPPPLRLRWLFAVGPKQSQPAPGRPGTPPTERLITMQLTADQQVALSITGEDAYGNPVDISAAVVLWASSDTSVVAVNVDENDDSNAVAVAVGPVGTSAVTVTNAAGTFQGSLAIDVVAGEVAEIVINPGEPTDKP